MTYATELVRIRLKQGTTLERLKALRTEMAEQYTEHYGGSFDVQMYELEDGTYLDIWTWETRELAEAALGDTSKIPAFERWKSLVEVVSFDWAAEQDWGRHAR
ncbi:MAG TPA: hypothetical protein VNT22_03085 [Baekduia sp.]|nr:hypothetical protein [Baekduia sp.]